MILEPPEEWGKERPDNESDKEAVFCGLRDPHPRHKHEQYDGWVKLDCLGRGPTTVEVAAYHKTVEAIELTINQVYGTDPRHTIMAIVATRKAMFDLHIPWGL